MPESATQPQSDTPSDTQPAIGEPLLAQEPPPPEARWRVSRSALLLIGGPLAGALLVWLAISVFSSNRTDPVAPAAEPPVAPPAAVTEQPAQPAPEPIETQPATEAQPAMEANVAAPAEAEPARIDPEPQQQAQQPDAPTSAINEVMPKVPQSALNTISGTVRVSIRVSIDNAGAVIDAIAADPGPSRYFERLSVDAARKWTFEPTNAKEPRTMLLKFNFTREGVTAQANQGEG